MASIDVNVDVSDIQYEIVSNWDPEEICDFVEKIVNDHYYTEEIKLEIMKRFDMLRFTTQGSSAILNQKGIKSLIAFLQSPKCGYKKAIVHDTGLVEFV